MTPKRRTDSENAETRLSNAGRSEFTTSSPSVLAGALPAGVRDGEVAAEKGKQADERDNGTGSGSANGSANEAGTARAPPDAMRAYRACLNCRNRKSKCDLDGNAGRPVSRL